MTKTPKADALRALRERRFEHSILERGNMRRVAKQALAKAEAKTKQPKRRKKHTAFKRAK